MDIPATLRALYAERERLQRTIAAMESLRDESNGFNLRRRRGRKSMGLVERREVSERMKRYWATRHQKT